MEQQSLVLVLLAIKILSFDDIFLAEALRCHLCVLSPFVVVIHKACLKLNFTPKGRNIVKVVFILK